MKSAALTLALVLVLVGAAISAAAEQVPAKSCGEILAPSAAENVASASTASFIGLLSRLAEKAGANGIDILHTIADTESPLSPIEHPAAMHLTPQDALVFRKGFSSILRQGDLEWNLIKQAAREMAGRKSETKKESEKAETATSPVFRIVNLPLDDIFDDRAHGRIVHFESSKGVRYMAGYEDLNGAGRWIKIVNLGTQQVHEIELRGIAPCDTNPSFMELPTGEVAVVFEQADSVDAYNAETGKPMYSVPISTTKNKLPEGVRAKQLKKLVPFINDQNQLGAIITWQKETSVNGVDVTIADVLYRINLQIHSVERLRTKAEQHDLYLSPDKRTVYSVGVAVTIDNNLDKHFALHVDNLSTGRSVTTKTFSARFGVSGSPFKEGRDASLYKTRAGELYLGVRFLDDIYVYNLTAGGEPLKKRVLDEGKPPIGFYEDQAGGVFFVVNLAEKEGRVVTENKSIVRVIDIRNQTLRTIAEFHHGAYQPPLKLLVTKVLGPIAIWQHRENKKSFIKVLEFRSGQVHSLNGTSDSFITDLKGVYETPDGRIEVIQTDFEQNFFRQIYGPLPEKGALK